MGCDIHTIVEERKNGQWTFVPGGDRMLESRNYRLFAILANVRNGYGFAGVPTGTGYKYIAEPRDFPKDLSVEAASWASNQQKWCHSFTHFTIRELLDFDWSQKTERQGWVNRDGFRQWKFLHKPREFCGDIMGKNVRKVSVAEMTEDADENTYCLVKWDEYYHEAAGELALCCFRLLHKANPEDVRLLICFDN